MAAPAPAPLPSASISAAPLPGNSGSTATVIPVPPKLSDRLLNLGNTDRYFVNVKTKSHGKQWIASCLEKKGLIEVDSTFLPNDKCIFYWCQREYAFKDDHLFSGKEKFPCIAFTPSQGLITEKVRLAAYLYKYYGCDAWKITPMTWDIQWNKQEQEWIVSDEIKNIIESKPANHVWITKSSFGSLGTSVFLYRGNSLKSFKEFIGNKYRAQSWGKKFVQQGYMNAEHLNLRQLILQQYIDKPLLFNGSYKFDLRVYSLLASTNPCILFYHIGKMRICGVKYSDFSKVDEDDAKQMMDSEELLYGHLSNCKIQRSHNDYDHNSSSIDGQTMLNDWDSFLRFIYEIAVEKRQFNDSWFEKYQYKIDEMTMNDMKDLINIKCMRLLSQCQDAFCQQFDQDSIKYNRPCQFIFNGDDIIIDENGKFLLLEKNRCPSISLVGHESIKQMTKEMLKEMIDILLEIRQLKMNGHIVDQNTRLKSPNKWLKCKLNYRISIVDRVNALIDDLDVLLK